MASRVSNPKALCVGLLAVLIVCFGFTSAAAASPVKTKVVLDSSQSRLYGYIRSDSPVRCSAGRQIQVVKVRKGRPDLNAGIGKSRKFGKGWQWSLRKDSAPGRYRAKVLAKPGCAASHFSRPVRLAPKGPYDVYCPLFSGGYCNIGTPDNRLHFFTYPVVGTCPSISETVGNCEGITDHGSHSWHAESGAQILWSHKAGESFIRFLLAANGANIEGHLPDPGSNRLTVTSAQIDDTSGRKIRLCTLDLPGVAAGDPGGPINFDFENEVRGAEVYFTGALNRARSATEC